jgi:hypothetical protein
MPRRSRIDAPGALHHIIVRGIETKWGLPLTLIDIVLFFPHLIFNFFATFFSLETFW